MLDLDKSYQSLIDLLEAQAKNHPSLVSHSFISDASLKSTAMTFHDLSTMARSIASFLQQQHCELGQRVLLIYPPGPELIAAFFACLYAGLIATPVYPPINDKLISKLKYIMQDCTPSFILTSLALKQPLAPLFQQIPSFIRYYFSDEVPNEYATAWIHPPVNSSTIALLQYTSGSTSNPKGVKISHQNLLNNTSLIYSGFDIEEIDEAICWLPPYHDMGLMSGVLMPLAKNRPSRQMSSIIHGRNYYPQDIELLVENAHPQIRKNCVAAFSIDEEEEERLAIIAEVEVTSDKDYVQLIDAICASLTKEMELTPASIAFIPPKTMPKTTSGKVQRQLIKETLLNNQLNELYLWRASHYHNEDNLQLQTIEDEANICEIDEWIIRWFAHHFLLKEHEIDLSKPFIEYGLDSVAIIQFMHDLSEFTALSLSPLLVWTYSTPVSLIDYINDNKEKMPKLLSFKTYSKQEYELSPNQQRLWFMQMLSPDSLMFNTGCAFKLTGHLEPLKLKEVLNRMIAKHDVLRTSIIVEENKPRPIVKDQLDHPLTTVDTSEMQTGDIKKIIKQEILRPYDLEKSNLIRFLYLPMNSRESILLVAAHHLIFDGWSMSLFIEEFLSEYDNHGKIAPLQLQYYDYATWQQQHFESNKQDEAINFWLRHLEKKPTYLSLPLDRPRTSRKTNITRLPFALPASIHDKINNFCTKEGITPFILFFTSFQLILAHYAQQKEYIIGIPVIGRNYAPLKNLLGFFTNTLPIAVQIQEGQTLSELLHSNQKIMLESYQHQNVPLAALLSHLEVERNILYEPLFQVMFVMQNIYPKKPLNSSLECELYWADSGQLPYDLTLEVRPVNLGDNSHYEAFFNFNAELFNADTIENLAKHFTSLLIALAEGKTETSAWHISLIDQHEHERLLNFSRGLEINYPPNKSVIDLFYEQTARTPEKIAIKTEKEKMTYLELNEKSNQLANFLIAQGAQPEKIITLSQKRSLDLVVSFLAVLKTGAAYLYIDPELPEKQQEKILHQVQPLYQLNAINWENVRQYEKENVNKISSLKSMAYLIYTSGSTGEPKGVVIEHHSFYDRMYWYINTSINTNKFMHCFSFSFDGGLVALWWPLLQGSTVVLPQSLKQMAYPILDMIKKERITTLHVTPSLIDGVIGYARPGDFSSVTDVVVAGELFTPHLLKKLTNQFANQHTRVWNFYGVTECTIISTFQQLTGKEKLAVPIGQPLPNTQCYVLDEYQQLTPLGLIGELYIGGHSLAREYLNQPELTQEKFVANPYSPATKLYRTGDRVRWNNRGELEYLGRNDRQVKLRGYRIELSAIEAALVQLQSVYDAVVMLREDKPGQKQLVAYLVSANKQPEDVTHYLKQVLPDFMLPDQLFFIDHIPLTSHGKIDYKKLPHPDDLGQKTNFVAPRRPIEKQLTVIWGFLFRLPATDISIDDNFFQLGGDSILCMQFVLMCREQGLFFSPQDVMKCKTIRILADLYDKRNTGKKMRGKISIYRRIKEKLFKGLKDRMVKRYQVSTGRICNEGNSINKPLITAMNHIACLDLVLIY